MQIAHTIKGIPCFIEVLRFKVVKGSFSYNAPSDMDYYGYTESEWYITDRKGYRAGWLEAKMDDTDRAEVESIIASELACS